MELPSRVSRTLVAAILLGAPGFAADEQPVPGLPPAAKTPVDDSAASKLIERTASTKAGFRMPPAGAPLSAEEIGLLRAWIDQGAVWPKTTAPVFPAPSKQKDHWSFRPVVRAGLPTVRNRQWVRNPIDAFILSKLESKGVAPSPEADKITLIRRLSFALTGLPPSRDEVEAFLADNRPDAYERLADRLLASEHYGERWAQYWMDLARYADSDGYEKDLPRPHAWRWREWVIGALNRDMPFDEFTIEQIAGDLLPGATVEQQVATGFHRNTLKNREAGVKRDEARFEEVINRVGTVGTVWLGLTVECAQCHDHKFDPIAQKDFYQLFAYFNNAEEADINAPLPGEMGPYLSALPAYRKSRSELLSQYPVASWQADWEQSLNRSLDTPGVSLDWDYEITELRARLDHSERMIRKGLQRRTLRENDLITDYFIRYPGPDNKKNQPVAEKLKELQKKLAELRERTPALTQAYVLKKAEEDRETHIALRGDYRAPGVQVQPDTPGFLPHIAPTDEPPRLQLAKWLVSPQNPLTARVGVRRPRLEHEGDAQTDRDLRDIPAVIAGASRPGRNGP